MQQRKWQQQNIKTIEKIPRTQNEKKLMVSTLFGIKPMIMDRRG